MSKSDTATEESKNTQPRRVAPVELAGYGLRQLARLALYSRTAGSMRSAASDDRDKIADLKPPPAKRVNADLRQLFLDDIANVRAGHYPMPQDNDGNVFQQADRIRAYFSDLPDSDRRRREGRHDEVLTEHTKGKRPRYYLQNFHFQTDGWMSDKSAKIYDVQVESLFRGTANVMRRHCLVPLSKHLAGKDQRRLRMLDVACGTGRLISGACAAFPRLNMLGLDLSEPYLNEARRHVGGRSNVRFALAKGEALPLGDNTFDSVATTFLFHELPPKIRREMAAEFARVLKPGGVYIHLDSLQLGDVPDYDNLLRGFPEYFHEPYHESYVKEDLAKLFGDCGLEQIEAKPVFMSKLVVFEKS